MLYNSILRYIIWYDITLQMLYDLTLHYITPERDPKNPTRKGPRNRVRNCLYLVHTKRIWGGGGGQLGCWTYFGWHYLSNATCLLRPRLFYAWFVVSRTIIICYMIRRAWRKQVSGKQCWTSGSPDICRARRHSVIVQPVFIIYINYIHVIYTYIHMYTYYMYTYAYIYIYIYIYTYIAPMHSFGHSGAKELQWNDAVPRLNEAQKCPWGEVPLVLIPVGTPGGHPSN